MPEFLGNHFRPLGHSKVVDCNRGDENERTKLNAPSSYASGVLFDLCNRAGQGSSNTPPNTVGSRQE